ncbi:hypothetical protein BS78_05G070400 [Paspalum vaginatum]|nr:hypothetical protein BS78_05G070400 [Paspalum vaginatum]
MAPPAGSAAGISLKSLLLFTTKQLEILETTSIVQYGAMAAYYLPTFIAFYAANEVYSSEIIVNLRSASVAPYCFFFFCCCCVRGADTMTAFTLGGTPHKVQSWRLLPWLLYFAWLQWLFIWSGGELINILYIIFYCIAPIIYVVVAKPRVSMLDYETKQFADYMTRQSKSSSPSPFFDAPRANSSCVKNGCNYPFKQKEDGEWIDLSGALQQLPEDFRVDEDSCLAYILGRLLARRYFGFPCAEDGNVQVRDFVFKELLPDYSRAFTIVEVQLAVLHDYFFTNYYSDLTYGIVSVKQGIVNLFWGLMIVGAGYLTSVLISASYGRQVLASNRNFLLYTTAMTTEFSAGVSIVIEKHTTAPRPQRTRLYCWRDKLSQYSVMEDYDHCSSLKKIIAWCKVHMLSQVSYSFMKHHPAEGKEVSVPDSVRRLVASTVKDLNGVPTIGTIISSLRALDDDLSWTCSQETLTHTILIWHIATCYCDMLSLSQPLPVEVNAPNHHEVATVLSGYCAYLVAFLPNLLPEHILTAKVVLQQVLQETIHKLGTTRMSMEEKAMGIQKLQLPQDESSMTTFEKGVRLGRQLEQLPDVSLRWKAMAYFWAQMILYLGASPDNAAAHVEQLAQGGEFITHVWALLCNAGIVNQAKEEWTR